MLITSACQQIPRKKKWRILSSVSNNFFSLVVLVPNLLIMNMNFQSIIEMIKDKEEKKQTSQ